MNKFLSISAFILLLAAAVLSGPTAFPSSAPEIKIETELGFEEKHPPAAWLPLSITVTNEGKGLEGELILTRRELEKVSGEIRVNEQIIPVVLPASSQKEFKTAVYHSPHTSSPLLLELRSENRVLTDHKIQLKRELLAEDLKPDYRVLVVGERRAGYEFLSTLEGLKANILYLRPEFLPEDWLGYSSIDFLIIDDADLTGLNRREREALNKWYSHGGTIILTGAADYDYADQILGAGNGGKKPAAP